MELVDHGGNIENWIQAALRKKQLKTTLEVFYYISVIWTCSDLVYLSSILKVKKTALKSNKV